MRWWKTTVSVALLLYFVPFQAQKMAAQSDPPIAAANDESAASATAITGHPFSATKYSREVKILPDGKQVILREHHRMELARDAAGRIRMKGGGALPYDCEEWAAPAPPICAVENVFVIDPLTQTVTHWPEGERAGPGAVIIKLSSAQVRDAEDVISTLPEQQTSEPGTDDTRVTTKDLGEKVIEGVHATGVRTTTVLPAGAQGNSAAITWIHEVWTSAEMKLVIRIVDGVSQGKETISGLEHISLQPDPALFEPPPAYPVWNRDNGDYANEDRHQLAEWFVQ